MALLRRPFLLGSLYYQTCWHATLTSRVSLWKPMAHTFSLIPPSHTTRPWNHKPSSCSSFSTSSDEEDAMGMKRKKKKADSGRFILQDENRAKYIVAKLKKYVDFKDPRVLVVECNPGDGLLTEKLLLRTRVPVLGLHAGVADPSLALKNLQNSRTYKERLHLRKGHLWDIQIILEEKSLRKYSQPPYKVKLIGSTFPWQQQASFTHWLMEELATDQSVFNKSGTESYFFVPEYALDTLGVENHMSDPSLMFTSVGMLRAAIFRLFFHFTIVGKMYVSDFRNPKDLVKKFHNGRHLSRTQHFGSERVYLVRMLQAHDLWTRCTRDDLPKLLSLVRLLRKHRNKPLYATMEYLCSGVTDDLVSAGLDETLPVGHLTRNQIFIIHQILLNQPNYLNLDLDNLSLHRTSNRKRS